MPIPIIAGVVAAIAGAFASGCRSEKEEFVTNKKGEKCVPNQTIKGAALCYSQGEYEKLTSLKSNIGRKTGKDMRYEMLHDTLYEMRTDERAQRFPGMQGALMTIVHNHDDFMKLRSCAAHALWPMPLPETTTDPDVIRAMSYGIRFDL